jgi:hypothetical protein
VTLFASVINQHVPYRVEVSPYNYRTNGLLGCNEQGVTYDTRVGLSTLISIRDAWEHLQLRRVWSRGFNCASLKDYNEIIVR